MNDKIKSRRLSAIMFTDIVDYSRLMGRDESAAMTLLENKEKNITHKNPFASNEEPFYDLYESYSNKRIKYTELIR